MRLTLTALAGGLALLASTRAGAEILYATNGSLVSRFDSTAPGFVINVPVTGLQAGETLVGIDVRPGTTTLYGVGSSNRMYTVNPVTGAATQVGAGTFSTALSGTYFGMGFNPVVDRVDLVDRNRVRLVSDTEQNLRLDPDTGALARADTALNPAGYVVGVSYDRNYLRLSGDTTPTTLYGID